MSEAGYNSMMKNGLRHNYKKVQGDALFTSKDGVFRILATALATGVNSPNKDLTTGDGNPLTQSVVKSLARLDSEFNTSVNSPNGRDGGKSLFGFTAPKFITDRTRDLKNPNSKIPQQLAATSFSKKSLWLNLILNSQSFRDSFEVSHIGLTAMKEMGKKVYKDNSITKLADSDHELTKLGMFWDTKQGSVTLDNGVNTYGDTGIEMRMSTMFVPTMSDKSNMMLLKTAVLNLEDKHFSVDIDNTQININNSVVKALYEQTVRPELLRMIRHAQLGGVTNIKGYDKGAKMFMMMPTLNNIMYDDKITLVQAITNGPELFNLDFIEGRKDLVDKIHNEVRRVLESQVEAKMKAWLKAGFFELSPTGKIVNMKFVDAEYFKKFTGDMEQRVRKAATDF